MMGGWRARKPMRDEFEDEYGVADDGGQPGWLGRTAEQLSNLLGAALALTLIVGLGFWGFRLSQRDVTAVPVIHAALSPAKVQPDDPGGADPAHQQIRSYAAGTGQERAPAITIAEPPERPAEEDLAMGALQQTGQGSAGPAEGAAEAVLDTASGPDGTETGTGGPPLGDGTDQAPAASPAAPTRPGDLAERMIAAQQADSAEAQLASLAAASAIQIQLGAYADREMTKTEWARIYKANEDILAGRALVVRITISGGRRFFRLRAGPFKSLIEARNVCRALQARDLDCLVAVNG